mmetsp:Transcript_20492/g.30078  ORF Transcript_20492/g.30078 Transcript_20492/m.30078 type:complete len:109 (+) Transcript_20492:274-600(+)|eukprot:CAMPEP_0173058570 /NCGR_PEP_ID=MMETSP1102-20130122/1434_1 /TAXON_ID=49646 /ORGANISM="Geminigera sp., Strain Caron Lab Isolate" /LENGTH=108 /DNA_ID=CAMNT_0013924341 /DNA_START=941 /DNA_END=1267 /DNA_ORIENTATION=-
MIDARCICTSLSESAVSASHSSLAAYLLHKLSGPSTTVSSCASTPSLGNVRVSEMVCNRCSSGASEANRPEIAAACHPFLPAYHLLPEVAQRVAGKRFLSFHHHLEHR